MMTTKPRASLGFGDDDDAPNPAEALKNFDPKAFQTPKPRPSNDRPDKDTIRKAGELAGFKSREGDKPAKEAAPAARAKPPRRQRHLTGRSEQVNLRATPEMKARFQALAEAHFATDADAFERAIELLEKHARS
ncbi:stability/partitioning determinant [Methylobacterium komagatae]|uniref:Stability/partitioning determinant n=1 Tax=Methylobacterium komagatae TaxID=374425 RepID=A0ABW2BTP5_9HYPH